MPSKKSPVLVVAPGPGKLSVGVAGIGSLAFPFGGGSGDLAAHLADTMDAHMASAIGVDPTNPSTGKALLDYFGGAFDGESVADALEMLADLLPPRPPRIGFGSYSADHHGLPDFGDFADYDKGGFSVTGAYTALGALVPTHCLLPGLGTSPFAGTVFPADRGVLAIYHSTDSDFLNPATTTLVAALHLGSSPPSGMATANFVEVNREAGQSNYTASGTGFDNISLTDRLPVLSDYSSFAGPPYADFAVDFPRYQVAKFTTSLLGFTDGSGYLVVHWRESFARSMAYIAPSALTLANLVPKNCYSATPDTSIVLTSGQTFFDVGEVANVVRRKMFRNIGGAGPNVTFTNVAKGPSLALSYSISGVQHYTGLQDFDLDFTINNLFDKAYLTGKNPHGEIPASFESVESPVTIDLSDFGGPQVAVGYHDLLDPASPFALGNAPATTDVARFFNPALFNGPTTPHTPFLTGQARVHVQPRMSYDIPTLVSAPATSTPIFMLNSYNQSGVTESTTTREHFRDERFRLTLSVLFVGPQPVEPAPGVLYRAGSPVITAADADLQVVGDVLCYPRNVDYTNPNIFPVQTVDYAAVRAADPADYERWYSRNFDTGQSRNIGRIRVKGVPFTAFQTAGAPTGSLADDHPGGCALMLVIQGTTEILDLGRFYGFPAATGQTYLEGCLISVEEVGVNDYILSYQTHTYHTEDNGLGEFPIAFYAAFIKNGVGENLDGIDLIEWLPPV